MYEHSHRCTPCALAILVYILPQIANLICRSGWPLTRPQHPSLPTKPLEKALEASFLKPATPLLRRVACNAVDDEFARVVVGHDMSMARRFVEEPTMLM